MCLVFTSCPYSKKSAYWISLDVCYSQHVRNTKNCTYIIIFKEHISFKSLFTVMCLCVKLYNRAVVHLLEKASASIL